MIKKQDVLVLVIVAVVLTAFLFFLKESRLFIENGDEILVDVETENTNVNSEPEYLQNKTENNEIGVIVSARDSGWKKYTNNIAHFSVSFPDYLYVFEEHESLGYKDYQKGRVIFCSEMIEKSMNYCNDGFQILYGIPEGDGWGGGCDREYHKEITVLGKSVTVCKTESSIGQLYLPHPEMDVETNIIVIYKEKFTEVDATKMLQSFSFVSE